jgi:hypothetical protein
MDCPRSQAPAWERGWLFDKDVGVKALFSIRSVCWRTILFGAALLLLAGCAGRSRESFSRWLKGNDDQKLAARSPGRDPFLDSQVNRTAELQATRVGAGTQWRRWDAPPSGTMPRSNLAAGRSRLTERFDRNRVAAVGNTQSDQLVAAGPSRFPDVNAASHHPASHPEPSANWRPDSPSGTGGDPFAAMDRRGGARTASYEPATQSPGPPPRDPFVTADQSRPHAAPFPHFPVIQAGVRRERSRPNGSRRSEVGGRRSPPLTNDDGPDIRPGVPHRTEVECRIIPAPTKRSPTPRQPVQPVAPQRTAERQPREPSRVVQVSTTRAEGTTSVLDADTRMVWRSVATLPTPGAAKKAHPAPPTAAAEPLPAPVAPVKAAPVKETPQTRSVAPLPFPTADENASRAVKSTAPKAEAPAAATDEAVTQPVANAADSVRLLRWAIYGAAGLAAIAVFLRRRRRRAELSATGSAAGR